MDMTIYPVTNHLFHCQLPLQTPAMPVNMKIPGGMKPGKMVRISGQPGNNPKRYDDSLILDLTQCGAYISINLGIKLKLKLSTH